MLSPPSSSFNSSIFPHLQDLNSQMERVDLTSGAEGMVERLTEQNLALEERVRMLQDEVQDMQAMADLAEEATDVLRESEAALNDDLNLITQERSRLMECLQVCAGAERSVAFLWSSLLWFLSAFLSLRSLYSLSKSP